MCFLCASLCHSPPCCFLCASLCHSPPCCECGLLQLFDYSQNIVCIVVLLSCYHALTSGTTQPSRITFIFIPRGLSKSQPVSISFFGFWRLSRGVSIKVHAPIRHCLRPLRAEAVLFCCESCDVFSRIFDQRTGGPRPSDIRDFDPNRHLAQSLTGGVLW